MVFRALMSISNLNLFLLLAKFIYQFLSFLDDHLLPRAEVPVPGAGMVLPRFVSSDVRRLWPKMNLSLLCRQDDLPVAFERDAVLDNLEGRRRCPSISARSCRCC